MRRSFAFALVAGLMVSAWITARAGSADAAAWFSRAAQVDSSGTGTQLARPDFLPGSSMESLCRASARRGPQISGTWALAAYDRSHRIGLATASTDECAVALFSAPTPPVRAVDADLSHYRTARGLHIGSPYADVAGAYGGPPGRGTHFVRHFWSHVKNAQTAGSPHRTVPLGEDIIVVVDNGRVSSIAMRIDLSALY